MSFLSPLFLVAAGAVAVPVLLHLLHRRAGRRRAFPALRYLRRTEREHASRIRLRQLLLLLLRTAALLLVVLAAARLVVAGLGHEHEPTALALVVDNSMSTGLVVGEERVLDRLLRAAGAALEEAGPDDRIWVLAAGEPWETPVPGGAARARTRLDSLEVAGTLASLSSAVARARDLVTAADLPAAEVHVYTDRQRVSWDPAPPGAPDGAGARSGGAPRVPVLVYHLPGPPPENRWLAELTVGGGLAPLVNRRTEIGVRVERSGAGAAGSGGQAGDTVRVRLLLDGRVTAAVDAPVGATVLIPAGPFPLGQVTGSVEIDPDGLRADDRRYFAFRVRPPPRVATGAAPGFFLEQALAVLADAGRIRPGEGGADVVVAPAGVGLEPGPGPASILVPPADPALLPAMNGRMRRAGIPWRVETAPGEGGLRVASTDVPVDLSGVRIRTAYSLVAADDPGGGGEVRVRRPGGAPWLVTGVADGRPYLLLASPLEPDATSLPLTAEMLPLVEWMVSGWAPEGGTASGRRAGTPLPVPERATAVREPGGTLLGVDGTEPVRSTGRPGIYEVLGGDSVLTRIAVNPPARESLLDRLEPDGLTARIAPPLQTESDPEAWPRRVFLRRRGLEVWRPLLVAALLVLAGESVLAAGGPGRRPSDRSGARRRSPEQSEPEASVGHVT